VLSVEHYNRIVRMNPGRPDVKLTVDLRRVQDADLMVTTPSPKSAAI